MALLTPNTTYTLNGVKVNEKIIPDGTKWKSATKAITAGFKANSNRKNQNKLCGTGKPAYVTIHNTDDIKNTNDDAEQYTRATYNENMGSVIVHYYVDDLGAWQNAKAGTGLCKNDPENSAEVTFHSGDTSNKEGGNYTSISLEVIMNDIKEHDDAARDNSARMAAWFLWKNKLSIDRLVTHTYWVNKKYGYTYADVDKQCTHPVKGKKWCPQYIFNSSNETIANKNWKTYKALVKEYLDELNSVKKEVYTIQLDVRYNSKIHAQKMVDKLALAGFKGFVTVAK